MCLECKAKVESKYWIYHTKSRIGSKKRKGLSEESSLQAYGGHFGYLLAPVRYGSSIVMLGLILETRDDLARP